MALTCGIVGLPLSGKTTLFNLLTNAKIQTGAYSMGKTAANVGHVSVPDRRLDYLAAMYHPKKTTYAQIEIIDIPGLQQGASTKNANEFLTAVRDADALVQVVRVFENESAATPIDIMRDIQEINTELLLADMQLTETRLERIQAGKKKKLEHPLEEATLLKCQETLAEEKPLSSLSLDEEEVEAIRHMTFMTMKPMLLVLNLADDMLSTNNYPQKAEVEKYAAENGIELLCVSAQMEEEIGQMDEEDRAVFMEELGLKESGIARMAQAVYAQLGLISFLTAGEDEVRAWTIRKGTNAKAAAGKIHSDIERGFIRAETIAFADLEELGSVAAARDKGKYRLEGKDYIVQDGDIINFRFNV